MICPRQWPIYFAFIVTLGCSEPNTARVDTDSNRSTEIRTTLENPTDSEKVQKTTAQPVTSAEPGGWGDLKGRFVYEGTPPNARRLTPTKDQQVCGKHDLFNESLIVNKENNGIQNVVVFVYSKRGESVPVHESYKASESAKVHMDNEWCRFNNHITVLRTTQTLLVRNLDTVGHNTKIDAMSNAAINPILAANSELEHQFSKAEKMPLPVSCSIHPWMSGYLLVKDHPYVSVTNENGEFELKNLPSGQLTLQVWQEKSKAITDVSLAGKKASWKRGRFAQPIGEGTTDLGDIMVSAKEFE